MPSHTLRTWAMVGEAFASIPGHLASNSLSTLLGQESHFLLLCVRYRHICKEWRYTIGHAIALLKLWVSFRTP